MHTDKKNATNSVGTITARLPLVSAKYPHKNDEQIIPKSVALPKIPFWVYVKFKSHSETGNT